MNLSIPFIGFNRFSLSIAKVFFLTFNSLYRVQSSSFSMCITSFLIFQFPLQGSRKFPRPKGRKVENFQFPLQGSSTQTDNNGEAKITIFQFPLQGSDWRLGTVHGTYWFGFQFPLQGSYSNWVSTVSLHYQSFNSLYRVLAWRYRSTTIRYSKPFNSLYRVLNNCWFAPLFFKVDFQFPLQGSMNTVSHLDTHIQNFQFPLQGSLQYVWFVE